MLAKLMFYLGGRKHKSKFDTRVLMVLKLKIHQKSWVFLAIEFISPNCQKDSGKFNITIFTIQVLICLNLELVRIKKFPRKTILKINL